MKHLVNNEGKDNHQSGNKTASDWQINKLKGWSEDNINPLEGENINQKSDYIFVKYETDACCNHKSNESKHNSFFDLAKIRRIFLDNYW